MSTNESKYKKFSNKAIKNQEGEKKMEEQVISEILTGQSLATDLINKKEEKEKTIIVDGKEIKANTASLRGRPRIHQEELVTIAPRVDQSLYIEMKNALTKRGYKVRDVLIKYMEAWVEQPSKFEYEYQLGGIERKSHSIKVLPDFRDRFSQTALALSYPQTFVMESLYKMILKDIHSDNLKV